VLVGAVGVHQEDVIVHDVVGIPPWSRHGDLRIIEGPRRLGLIVRKAGDVRQVVPQGIDFVEVVVGGARTVRCEENPLARCPQGTGRRGRLIGGHGRLTGGAGRRVRGSERAVLAAAASKRQRDRQAKQAGEQGTRRSEHRVLRAGGTHRILLGTSDPGTCESEPHLRNGAEYRPGGHARIAGGVTPESLAASGCG